MIVRLLNLVLTLLEAMLSTVRLRVQQEVNIYQFEVDNIRSDIIPKRHKKT